MTRISILDKDKCQPKKCDYLCIHYCPGVRMDEDTIVVDEDTKKRLALGERIVEVLKQKKNAPVRVGCQVAIVYAVVNGYLNDIAVDKVAQYEERLFELLETKYLSLLERFENNFCDDEDIAMLKKALDEIKE